MSNQKPKKEGLKFYLGCSAIGVGRVVAGFPFEHPIDAIKVQWQSQPKFKNEYRIIQHIWQTKGLVKGFYAGSLPNLTRLIMRNTYKYPLLVGLPKFYKNMSPSGVNLSESRLKMLSGVTLSLIESIITCPIERTKVFMMTMDHHKSQSSYM